MFIKKICMRWLNFVFLWGQTQHHITNRSNVVIYNQRIIVFQIELNGIAQIGTLGKTHKMFDAEYALYDCVFVVLLQNIQTVAVFRNFLFNPSDRTVARKNQLVSNTLYVNFFAQHRKIATNFLKHGAWNVDNTRETFWGNVDVAVI